MMARTICVVCFRCVRHALTAEARAARYGHLYSCRAGHFETLEPRRIPKLAACPDYDPDIPDDELPAARAPVAAERKRRPRGGTPDAKPYLNLALVLPAQILDRVYRYARGPLMVYLPSRRREPPEPEATIPDDELAAFDELPGPPSPVTNRLANGRLRRYVNLQSALPPVLWRQVRRRIHLAPLMAYLPPRADDRRRPNPEDFAAAVRHTFAATGSINKTAKHLRTSRQRVRRLLREAALSSSEQRELVAGD
jgi:hypothetical protein